MWAARHVSLSCHLSALAASTLRSWAKSVANLRFTLSLERASLSLGITTSNYFRMVNNAGVGVEGVMIHEMEEEMWDKTM